MVEPEVLFDKLASMTHSEIRDYCVQAGVQGEVQSDSSCVLANLFLRTTTAEAVRVSDYLQWTKDSSCIQEWDEPWGSQVEASCEMRVFIHEFDQGDYPELVTPYEEYE